MSQLTAFGDYEIKDVNINCVDEFTILEQSDIFINYNGIVKPNIPQMFELCRNNPECTYIYLAKRYLNQDDMQYIEMLDIPDVLDVICSWGIFNHKQLKGLFDFNKDYPFTRTIHALKHDPFVYKNFLNAKNSCLKLYIQKYAKLYRNSNINCIIFFDATVC